MIIKSKSRKVGNFDQLYDYMRKGAEKHDGVHVFSSNVYAQKRDEILKEFTDNAKLFKKRKNSIFLFHEIISITRSDQLSVAEQQNALYEIVKQYVSVRAKNNLVYGYMHDEKDNNIHFHLMISSNERGHNKNLRLTKKEFDTTKKELELWTNKHHPKLQQGLVINKQAGKKLSNKGAELKRRTGKMPERERVTKTLTDLFKTASDKQTFFNQLGAENLDIYVRGKAIGFVDIKTQRKYRLKTLGLVLEFEAMSQKIELDGKEFKQQTRTKKQPNKRADNTKAKKDEKLNNKTKQQQAKQKLEKDRRHNKTGGNTKSWCKNIVETVTWKCLDVILQNDNLWMVNKQLGSLISKQEKARWKLVKQRKLAQSRRKNRIQFNKKRTWR